MTTLCYQRRDVPQVVEQKSPKDVMFSLLMLGALQSGYQKVNRLPQSHMVAAATRSECGVWRHVPSQLAWQHWSMLE